ncbi:glycosyltransferase family 2 protein [Aeromonas dhakensis]|uniref:glycosyltransferase family 2 protein n=1 Tax=Aeromonas dhakensis TaxID=196024 RepID=UPI001BD15434|nr:glycosyltransferase family 2 protein [Aeromonas dhakensis]MBS4714659.1 glycosyltransferase family 2 protein [Aeromonas dhakensis]BEE00058.1 bactoprenol glucosyl transferase [Aeromonas dhakensis]
MSHADFRLSLIVPVYNEEESIDAFINAIDNELAPLKDQLEIVFVNDGSRDRTREVVEQAIARDPRVTLVNLARNFGKEAAMTAGLHHAKGNAVVPMDVDLQDPPSLILEFVKLWQTGDYDTVYGIRVDRSADTPMKRLTAGGFYRFFNALSTSTKLPENAGDFRLIDRKVVEAIKQLPERNRFMKGLFAWAGFRAVGVPYERPARHAGETKFNYWKLWNFALDGLMSFSSWPLRVWSYVGVGVSFVAFLYILKIVTQVVFFGIDVPGYASLMSVVLFLGGIQLLSLGIIGEYIGRMFVEVKQRPVYLIEGVYGQYAKQDEEPKQDAATGSKKSAGRKAAAKAADDQQEQASQ